MVHRVGVIGCGRMGRIRAEACEALGAEISVLYDLNQSSSRALAREHPNSQVVSTAASIPWGQLDEVFICTPPGDREEVSIAAIESGTPIFFEKPAALSVDSARPIATALRKKQTRNAVGYQNRYRESVQEFRAKLREHPPIGIVCNWVSSQYAKPWWMLTEHSGGPINDQMTHLVDLCRFLVGEVVDVVAIGGNNTPAGEHPKAAVAINFVNGACGTLFYSFLAHEKEIAFSAFTEEGAMHLRDWDFKAPGDVEEGDRNQIFVRETAAFLGIEGQIMCDFDDAMRTQGVIDTIKQALDTGRRLSIQNSGGAYVD